MMTPAFSEAAAPPDSSYFSMRWHAPDPAVIRGRGLTMIRRRRWFAASEFRLRPSSIFHRLVLSGGVGLMLWLGTIPLLAGDNAYVWLERMSAAMSQMNYQGTFVYVQGDHVETMRITHVSENGHQKERLVSISGTPREVVRDAAGVRWFSGEDRWTLSDPSVNRPILFELPLNDAARASDSYEFRLQGSERIAGRSARRLDVKPRDRFRYGYSLWLEAQSGLLLQWHLNDGDGKTLARLMFTDLRMGSEVDLRELYSSNDGDAAVAAASGLPAESRSVRRPPLWQARKVPPGFHLASHRAPEGDASEEFEHLVYSDGIAAVSVYVESLDRQPRGARGVSRMGTTHAFFRSLDDMFITVVGDVPEATVRLIGESVRPTEP
jgi:sigma-E factor negative regulatory protein RseB